MRKSKKTHAEARRTRRKQVKYKRRSSDIEAWQWNGFTFRIAPEWVERAIETGYIRIDSRHRKPVLYVKTGRGVRKASLGHWVLLDTDSCQLHVLRNDLFEALYTERS